MTVRIASLEDDTPTELDAAATWMLGHTERISFGKPYAQDGELVSDAVVRVPCKYLKAAAGSGRTARCTAHGFRGPVPRGTSVVARTFQHGGDQFTIVHGRRVRRVTLRVKRAARRALPIMQTDNPCDGAPCRTADNKVGAACCRDVTLDLLVGKRDGRIERLLRARKSPYLCKVKRTDERALECEVISACGYLMDDGIRCALHDRTRPNGRSAKPELCYDWPDFEDDDEYTGHPGCVFIKD